MVWFTKTTTDVLLACDAPKCTSVITQDASGISAASEYARAHGWKVGGMAYCPDHVDLMPFAPILGGAKAKKRRAEVLTNHPLAKEYTG